MTGKRLHAALLKYALSLPGAWEDHPWGESVAKIDKKIFAFFGATDPPAIHVKLPESADAALAIDGAKPTGYGLGKAGWVTIPMRGALPPIEILREWIDESYRAVASKKRIAELDR